MATQLTKSCLLIPKETAVAVNVLEADNSSGKVLKPTVAFMSSNKFRTRINDTSCSVEYADSDIVSYNSWLRRLVKAVYAVRCQGIQRSDEERCLRIRSNLKRIVNTIST